MGIFSLFIRDSKLIGQDINSDYIAEHIVTALNFRGDTRDDVSLWLTMRLVSREFRDLCTAEETYVNLSLIKSSGKMVVTDYIIDDSGFIRRYGYPMNMIMANKKILFYECTGCGSEVKAKNKSKHNCHKSNQLIPCDICGLSKKDHVVTASPPIGDYKGKTCPLECVTCGTCGHAINSVVYVTYHRELCSAMSDIVIERNAVKHLCCGKYHRRLRNKCERCMTASYCSDKCQIRDLSAHKERCDKVIEICNSQHLSKFWS